MPPTHKAITFGDLASAGRWLRYSLIPFLAVLLGAGIWVHDTGATVESLQAKDAARDQAVSELRDEVREINGKVDVILQYETRHHGPVE